MPQQATQRAQTVTTHNTRLSAINVSRAWELAIDTVAFFGMIVAWTWILMSQLALWWDHSLWVAARLVSLGALAILLSKGLLDRDLLMMVFLTCFCFWLVVVQRPLYQVPIMTDSGVASFALAGLIVAVAVADRLKDLLNNKRS